MEENQNSQISNPKIGGVKTVKLPKEHLRLPQLHFIAGMQWIDTLGEKAFCTYLKLFTMADRTGKSLKDDEAKIPQSIRDVVKEIGYSKTTFYEKVIKPLWNHNLIDLEEYQNANKTDKSHNPINIIVYPYPNMEYERMVMPLEKLRDYDTDYNSEARIIAKNRKLSKNVDLDGVQKLTHVENDENFVEGSENVDLDGVQKLTHVEGWAKNWTTGGLKIGQNNLRPNSLTSLKEEEEENASAFLSNPEYKTLLKIAKERGMDEKDSMKLAKYVHEKNVTNLTDDVIEEAFDKVVEDVEANIINYNLAKWTAGKIERVAKQKSLKANKSRKAANPNKDDTPKKQKSYGKKVIREELIPEYWGKEEKPKKVLTYEEKIVICRQVLGLKAEFEELSQEEQEKRVLEYYKKCYENKENAI